MARRSRQATRSRVHIGVGTAAGSEIQIVNEQGKPELLRDANGEVVRSRLDEATLRANRARRHMALISLGPAGRRLAKVRIAAESLNQTAGAAPGASSESIAFTSPCRRPDIARHGVINWHSSPQNSTDTVLKQCGFHLSYFE